ncbi:SDR family oxidoreductase [Streptomyces sp. NPDC046805]|uniref:SDR family oxidoreductase n=1 Tax=Streptomyces sp. NPDC046805 TaxID=3155134 RepID=UPI00340D48FC
MSDHQSAPAGDPAGDPAGAPRKGRPKGDPDSDIVVVTGAATGVGRALAVGAAARGATVVVADVTDGLQTVEAITATGGSAVAHHVDVTDYASTAELIDFVDRSYGRLNVLINNAVAGAASAPLDVADPDGTRHLSRVPPSYCALNRIRCPYAV